MRTINSIEEKMKQELSSTKTVIDFGTFYFRCD